VADLVADLVAILLLAKAAPVEPMAAAAAALVLDWLATVVVALQEVDQDAVVVAQFVLFGRDSLEVSLIVAR
jgi:hypothetical protein